MKPSQFFPFATGADRKTLNCFRLLLSEGTLPRGTLLSSRCVRGGITSGRGRLTKREGDQALSITVTRALLMSTTMQASLPLGLHTHNNQGLFADHYLDHPERLQALDEWRQATGIEEAFRKIAHLYSDKAVHFNRRTNEHQTEHEFIRPVLNLLWREQRSGDCYQVQVDSAADVRRQPDYAFFRTVQERRAADTRKGSLDYWRDVPALGDAKAWFGPLDKQRGADDNPTAQICNYLYRSRIRWGILTNGRIWRLYEREKSSAGGIYYEVNLEELLQCGDLEAFKYFYLFFRREAFLPDHTGISFIEKVFQGSVDYATQVGDQLKESIYDALRLLMNGFFEYPANQLNRQDPTP